MESDLVIVDTCVWIPFFQKKGHVLQSVVSQLIQDDRVAIVGPVIFEILRGIKRKETSRFVESQLRKLHYLEMTWNDWAVSSDLDRELTKVDLDLPPADIHIAAIALRTESELLTIDPHFRTIADLKLFDADSRT